MKDSKIFIKTGIEFHPSETTAEIVKKLPPNIYSVTYDEMTEKVSFIEISSQHDELINLPGTEYEEVMSDVNIFFSEEYKKKIKKTKLLGKQNILLYGVPGSGKTSIINRLSKEFIKRDGIVLFNPPPESLVKIYNILEAIQPETIVLVIFEELDTLIRYSENELLSILDGELQKPNVTFVASTNFIADIPPRILRPGRFAIVREVGMPSKLARQAYLETKMEDKKLIDQIVKATDGFSIDELKEIVRSVYCMGKDVATTIKRLESSLSRKTDPRLLLDDNDDDVYGFNKRKKSKNKY